MSQRIIDRNQVGEVLQQLYISDLKVQITLFLEGGYFYIGNEDRSSPLQGTTIEEAVTHLAYRVATQFPASKFSEWWKLNFRADEFKAG